MAFFLQDLVSTMMASVTGVEDPPKKAISGLPGRRGTLSFFHRGDGLQSNFLCESAGSGANRGSIPYGGCRLAPTV
jgi:hypothetical protein